jgi:hypothetical protein
MQPSSTKRNTRSKTDTGVRCGRGGWCQIACSGISQRYPAPRCSLTSTDSVQGEQVSEFHPVSFHYTRNFRPGQSLVVEDDLIACSDDNAPEAYGKELIHVCTLTTDLSAVPKSLFTRLTTTKGVEFDNLDFSLDMRVQSAGLLFELRVEGVRYGVVEAKFH